MSARLHPPRLACMRGLVVSTATVPCASFVFGRRRMMGTGVIPGSVCAGGHWVSAFCLWVAVLRMQQSLDVRHDAKQAPCSEGNLVLCSLPDRVPLRALGRPVSMRAAAAAQLGDKSTACVLPVEQRVLCLAAGPLGSRIACGEAVPLLRFSGTGSILAGRLRLSTTVRMHEFVLWCLGVWLGGLRLRPSHMFTRSLASECVLTASACGPVLC